MLNKILIATNNKHKREKLRWIVKGFFNQIEFPENLPTKIRIEESGSTFSQNASLKAVAYSKIYDGLTIATDGGIDIPSLGKSWDSLKTRRFVGEEKASDFARIKKLLELMKDKKGQDRKMIWREAVALAKNGKLLFTKEVKGIEGVLEEKFDQKKYKEGIWVCSVWYSPQFRKNFFDLTPPETKEVEISWSKLRQATRNFLKNY